MTEALAALRGEVSFLKLQLMKCKRQLDKKEDVALSKGELEKALKEWYRNNASAMKRGPDGRFVGKKK